MKRLGAVLKAVEGQTLVDPSTIQHEAQPELEICATGKSHGPMLLVV